MSNSRRSSTRGNRDTAPFCPTAIYSSSFGTERIPAQPMVPGAALWRSSGRSQTRPQICRAAGLLRRYLTYLLIPMSVPKTVQRSAKALIRQSRIETKEDVAGIVRLEELCRQHISGVGLQKAGMSSEIFLEPLSQGQGTTWILVAKSCDSHPHAYCRTPVFNRQPRSAQGSTLESSSDESNNGARLAQAMSVLLWL